MSVEAEPLRIVMADDEPAVRVLLSRQLRRAGYHVIACANGREALDAITEHGADIVLADWMMPEIDGIELCRTVRGLSGDGALGFIFFILLTAMTDKEQVVEGFEAGVDDYLTKPYHENELMARLRAGVRIIKLQRLVQERQVEVHRINAEMAILNGKLQEQATTDELTRLHNRRSILERLGESWELSGRHQRPLSFLMLDIDHFKRFNDTHGHEAGDVVLKEVAAGIKRQMRGPDVCGRLGGEEFAVLCPETDLEGAAHLAERIRCAVEALQIRHHGQSLSTTLSIGVAQRCEAHDTFDALIADADKALYHAKANGRNAVGMQRDGEPATCSSGPAGSESGLTHNSAH